MKHYPTLALILSTCAFAPLAQANDILSILETQSQSDMTAAEPPKNIPYRYTVTADLMTMEGDDISQGAAVLQIDPSQPAGQRTTLISADDPETPALLDFIKEIEKPKTDMESMADDFWCGSASSSDDFDASTFTVLSETDTEAVLKPNPGTLTELLMQSDADEDMDKQERKMMKKLVDRIDGELILSKPDAQMKGFRVNMTRSMTIMMIAKVKKMEIEQSCSLAPNGFRYASNMKMSVRGKALGTEFGQDMDIRISDLVPLPQ